MSSSKLCERERENTFVSESHQHIHIYPAHFLSRRSRSTPKIISQHTARKILAIIVSIKISCFRSNRMDVLHTHITDINNILKFEGKSEIQSSCAPLNINIEWSRRTHILHTLAVNFKKFFSHRFALSLSFVLSFLSFSLQKILSPQITCTEILNKFYFAEFTVCPLAYIQTHTLQKYSHTAVNWEKMRRARRNTLLFACVYVCMFTAQINLYGSRTRRGIKLRIA